MPLKLFLKSIIKTYTLYSTYKLLYHNQLYATHNSLLFDNIITGGIKIDKILINKKN